MSDIILPKKRKMHPNSLKNLRPVQPGQILNPAGRTPREDCLISCIKRELDLISLNGKNTKQEIIAAILVERATQGATWAIKLLLEYNVVKPTVAIDLTSKGKQIFHVVDDPLPAPSETQGQVKINPAETGEPIRRMT